MGNLFYFAALTTGFIFVIYLGYKNNLGKDKLKGGDLKGAFIALKDVNKKMEKLVYEAIEDRKNFLLLKKELNGNERKELIDLIIITNTEQKIERKIIFNIIDTLSQKEKEDILILTSNLNKKLNNNFLIFLTAKCEKQNNLRLLKLAGKTTSSIAHKKKFKERYNNLKLSRK